MSVPTYLAVDKAVQRNTHRPDVHRLHITKLLDKSLTRSTETRLNVVQSIVKYHNYNA